MFVSDLFVGESEPNVDTQRVQLLKKAKIAHPLAASDEEALALYVADKEINDVNRLDKVNDREDRSIDNLASSDRSLEKKLTQMQAQISNLQDKLKSRKSK